MMAKAFLSGVVVLALVAACSTPATPSAAAVIDVAAESAAVVPSTTIAAASDRPTALPTSETIEPATVPTSTPALLPTAAATATWVEPVAGSNSTPALTQVDTQGAVEFAVTPLNLGAPGATLDFDISLNTHSVDLAWDLAAQSALMTDTGLEVKGLSWPVGGGHHYTATLTFPATIADGSPLLDGARTLTLRIRDAGVPERVFAWDVFP